MGVAFVTFLAVFLLIASGGLLLFYREVMLKRISEAITPHPKQKSLTSVIERTKFSIGQVVERFDKIMPKSEKEVSVVLQRLQRAGYRDEQAVKFFYGCKVVTPLLLCAVAYLSGLSSLGPFFVYLVALGGGFLLPDFWLGKKIEKRQKKITRGLPDVLDMLVICMEAGLSLDQATARSAQELSKSTPELCDELRVVVLEQRAGTAALRGLEEDGRPHRRGKFAQPGCHAGADGTIWNEHSQDASRSRRHAAYAARTGGGGDGGEDIGKVGISPCVLYLPSAVSGYTGTSRDCDV